MFLLAVDVDFSEKFYFGLEVLARSDVRYAIQYFLIAARFLLQYLLILSRRLKL